VLHLFIPILVGLAGCHRDELPPDAPRSRPAPTPPAPKAPTPEQVAAAGPANANVEFVRAILQPDGTWTLHVTVRHPDTGWTDYADGWDVVLPDGTVVLPEPEFKYTRPLQHPHEEEQPFTRSQNGILIPDGVTTFTVRAHDLLAGWGGQTITVDLGRKETPEFAVIRR